MKVIGKVVEFNDSTGTDTLTQIQAYSVASAGGGAGTVLPVLNQAASSLNMPANGEPMESVLVELKNVKITTLGADPNYIATLTQAGGTTLKGDDDIYRFVSADLNDCFASLIGFWSYNPYENSYVFLPRRSGSGPDGTLAGSATLCN